MFGRVLTGMAVVDKIGAVPVDENNKPIGDVLIVSPNSEVRRGDRVVVKTTEGEVLAKTLDRKTAQRVELASFNPDHPNLAYALEEIAWMARIIWASQ